MFCLNGEPMVLPGQHKLTPLPYPYGALEPVLSAGSVRLHHDILQQKYVDGLNSAELKLAEARIKNDFDLIRYWENELAFNGSGNILHSIYWTGMAPVGRGGQPGTETFRQINGYFGSFDAFRAQFSAAANKIQGSSWAILTWQPAWQRLEILQAEKHQNGTQWSGIPVLVLDVWEHAYYPAYNTKRDEYIEKWWQLVNWYEVEYRLRNAMAGRISLSMT